MAYMAQSPYLRHHTLWHTVHVQLYSFTRFYPSARYAMHAERIQSNIYSIVDIVNQLYPLLLFTPHVRSLEPQDAMPMCASQNLGH